MADYLFLIYGDESAAAAAGPEDWEQMLAAHGAWQQEVVAAGGTIKGGEALQPSFTATTVRQGVDGVTVLDGPFAETKEALGGFYLVEVPDLDAALALARTLPSTGAVEVRPVQPTG